VPHELPNDVALAGGCVLLTVVAVKGALQAFKGWADKPLTPTDLHCAAIDQELEREEIARQLRPYGNVDRIIGGGGFRNG
jgi:hypothetical protein